MDNDFSLGINKMVPIENEDKEFMTRWMHHRIQLSVGHTLGLSVLYTPCVPYPREDPLTLHHKTHVTITLGDAAMVYLFGLEDEDISNEVRKDIREMIGGLEKLLDELDTLNYLKGYNSAIAAGDQLPLDSKLGD